MSTIDILTVEQAARELGMSGNRVRALCRAGRLGRPLGSRWIITVEELRQFKKIPRNPGNPNFLKKKAQ